MLTQVIIFGVFMFSPVNFPPERLPAWLAALHRLLPVQAMAEVVRGALAGGEFAAGGRAYLVLGGWCVAGFAASYAALARRH